MQLNFIDVSKWDFYNKVYSYSKTKRLSYYVDDIEAKQIREAAPLVKFTYKKSVRAAEQEMLQHLLVAADHMMVSSVLVTNKAIQLMSGYNRFIHEPSLIGKFVASNDSSKYITTHMDTSGRLVQVRNAGTWYGRHVSLTPIDSEIDALYVKQDDAWLKISSRTGIINHIDGLGFVSRPGNPPTAVPTSECSLALYNQINEVALTCERLGAVTRWSKVLIKEAQKLLRDYRTPNTTALKNRIKPLITLHR